MLIKKGWISREATEQSVQKISTKALADTTNCFQPFLPNQDYHSKKRRHKTLEESHKLFNTTYTDANAVDFAWLMIIEWIYVGDVSLKVVFSFQLCNWSFRWDLNLNSFCIWHQGISFPKLLFIARYVLFVIKCTWVLTKKTKKQWQTVNSRVLLMNIEFNSILHVLV